MSSMSYMLYVVQNIVLVSVTEGLWKRCKHDSTDIAFAPGDMSCRLSCCYGRV